MPTETDHTQSSRARIPDGGTAPTGEDTDGRNRREWVLVGLIVLSFIVIPGIVLVRPPALPFRFAYLVLPLLPAVLLGGAAVWVALNSQEAENAYEE